MGIETLDGHAMRNKNVRRGIWTSPAACSCRPSHAFALALGVVLGWFASSAGAESPASGPDVILVVGAEGEPEYGKVFSGWADRWEQAARQAGGKITRIGDKVPEDPAGSSDRDRLQSVLAAVDPAVSQPVWIVLMGHGTFTQNVAKFNLRGPDLSAADLSGWLQGVTRPVVVINTFSASGPFINSLSHPNRVIVSATQSGIEQNYARLGEYLSQAILDPAADIDHDGEVSILEAFLAGAAKVRAFYEGSGRLLTENALIDDNADGLGTPATAFRGVRPVAKADDPTRSLDGRLAAKITMSPESVRLPFTVEELAEREVLEGELERLRASRSELAEADYQAAVLPLFIRLAKLYQAAEARMTTASP